MGCVFTIEDYEEEQRMDEFFRRMDDLHKIRERESDQHYEETGKLDAFAWAEIESHKYDEYCRKMEEEYEKQQAILEEEELEETYNNEY